MKVLLTGAGGFVGHAIHALSSLEIIPAPSLRDADAETVRRIVAQSGAEAIVHTAAISDIGTCEQNPEASYRANVLLPVYLAQAAEGRKLICFSSDQVYSGSAADGPYREADAAPANCYARHKLEMEQRVLEIDPTSVHLRAEWMYDYHAPRPNYLLNVLGGARAFSSRQYRGVTYVKEVAEAMPAVLALPGGAYNFGSETMRSMFEITAGLLRQLGIDEPTQDAPARHNLWMDCRKAAQQGVHFSSVEDGLARCLQEYGLSAQK